MRIPHLLTLIACVGCGAGELPGSVLPDGGAPPPPPPPCQTGATETRACENGLGTQTRSCDGHNFGAWSQCAEPSGVFIAVQGSASISVYADYLSPLQHYYQSRGVTAKLEATLPADVLPYKLIVVGEPSSWLDDAALNRLVDAKNHGRRVVVVGDHCRGGVDGCFVDDERIEQVMTALGVASKYDGSIGVTSERAHVASNPLTAGVATLPFTWSGALLLTSGGDTVPLATAASGDVLMAVAQQNRVVVVADLDVLKASSSDADVKRFADNLLAAP